MLSKNLPIRTTNNAVKKPANNPANNAANNADKERQAKAEEEKRIATANRESDNAGRYGGPEDLSGGKYKSAPKKKSTPKKKSPSKKKASKKN